MSLPPTIALSLYGVGLGVTALLIFKFTSRPERVLRARNRALSRVLELWLYRGDPWLGFRSLGSMVGDSFRYLASLLPPLLCSLLPLALLLYLAHETFAFRALRPGETVLVVARLGAHAPETALQTLSFVPPTALQISLPPVVTPAWREAAWACVAQRGVTARALRGYLRTLPRPRGTSFACRLPAATYNLLGWHTGWLEALLTVSLVTGLVLKRPFNVEF